MQQFSNLSSCFLLSPSTGNRHLRLPRPPYEIKEAIIESFMTYRYRPLESTNGACKCSAHLQHPLRKVAAFAITAHPALLPAVLSASRHFLGFPPSSLFSAIFSCMHRPYHYQAPLSSEAGTNSTVNARCWPCLEAFSRQKSSTPFKSFPTHSVGVHTWRPCWY
jgi:hypothetical protein